MTVRKNDIVANEEAGLSVEGHMGEPVSVAENWWGESTGPSGGIQDACNDGSLADGDGDVIQTDGAGVCFAPWLQAPPAS